MCFICCWSLSRRRPDGFIHAGVNYVTSPLPQSQQVQPDEAAKQALQEYLRKQKEASEKPAQEVQKQTPEKIDLSIGKLLIKASEQTNIFNLQVDNKDSLVLNIATPDKIIITPITPEQPTITVLENHVEIDWAKEIKPQETVIAEPIEVTEPPRQ
jgi:seryl-tRNA(Sec) selenium transferase